MLCRSLKSEWIPALGGQNLPAKENLKILSGISVAATGGIRLYSAVP